VSLNRDRPSIAAPVSQNLLRHATGEPDHPPLEQRLERIENPIVFRNIRIARDRNHIEVLLFEFHLVIDEGKQALRVMGFFDFEDGLVISEVELEEVVAVSAYRRKLKNGLVVQASASARSGRPRAFPRA